MKQRDSVWHWLCRPTAWQCFKYILYINILKGNLQHIWIFGGERALLWFWMVVTCQDMLQWQQRQRRRRLRAARDVFWWLTLNINTTFVCLQENSTGPLQDTSVSYGQIISIFNVSQLQIHCWIYLCTIESSFMFSGDYLPKNVFLLFPFSFVVTVFKS